MKSVKVRMTGLNALKITVTEKKMIGYVTLADGTYAYFDRDGVVQEVSDRLLEGLLPVGGISCEKARAGDELPVDEEILTYLTALLKGLEKYEITPEEIPSPTTAPPLCSTRGYRSCWESRRIWRRN